MGEGDLSEGIVSYLETFTGIRRASKASFSGALGSTSTKTNDWLAKFLSSKGPAWEYPHCKRNLPTG